ncbi:hypothetical protein [Alloscardovia venturai]|uniref:hypothetical protein n=1 Tax=Alloscardovia venturai TaxID=1769421 RepID=UPI003672008C
MSFVIWNPFTRNNKHFSSYPGVHVEQTVKSLPKNLRIGVVVSYTDDLTQGTGWDGNGEGITVAKWRLKQAGTDVQTVIVSDDGSTDGAVEAIQQLAHAHVSGVIALTSHSYETTCSCCS